MLYNLFREYDIRGEAKYLLSNNASVKIGYYFAKLTKASSMVIGYDARLSSQDLFIQFAYGAYIAGIRKIFNIGRATSPMLYFASKTLESEAAVCITGSHNPADCNGFKLLKNDIPFYGEDIFQLRDLVLSDTKEYGLKEVRVKNIDLSGAYIESLLKSIEIPRDIKVLWDAGNGVAGPVLEQIVKRLPNNNHLINTDVDGSFPNYLPDPSKASSLKYLIDKVKEFGADVGFAFDGDADRVGVVTSSGKIIAGDKISCIFTKEILKQDSKAKIVADIKTTKAILDIVNDYGGNIRICKTGHPYIKKEMRNFGAEFGGEMSGHMFFADRYYGYDDGIYAALRFLEILLKSNKNAEQLLSELPKYETGDEVRVAVDEEKKFLIMNIVKILISDQEYDNTDGVKMVYSDGWWLIRASNTESCIVIKYEAKTKLKAYEYRNIAEGLLRRAMDRVNKKKRLDI